MKNFKYQYEQHPAKKGRCPQCEKNNVFRFIVDTFTHERMPPQFGICDRINSCGYLKFPERTYDIGFTPMPQYVKTQTAPIKFVPQDDLIATTANFFETNLYKSLLTKYSQDQLEAICCKYFLGGTRTGEVLFWSLNLDWNIVNAKQMKYTKEGKRDKTTVPKTLYTKENGYGQSLFGSHLIKNCTGTINIVESEKTALIAALSFP